MSAVMLSADRISSTGLMIGKPREDLDSFSAVEVAEAIHGVGVDLGCEVAGVERDRGLQMAGGLGRVASERGGLFGVIELVDVDGEVIAVEFVGFCGAVVLPPFSGSS